MAVVLIEGFEGLIPVGDLAGSFAFNAAGWVNFSNSDAGWQVTVNPRPRASGDPAGVGCFRPTQAGGVPVISRFFPWNEDTNDQLRLREVYVGFGLEPGPDGGINPNTPFGQVSVGPYLAFRRIGLCVQSDRMRIYRNGTGLVQDQLGAIPAGVWGGFWFGVYIDQVNGWARGFTDADYPAPFIEALGDTSGGPDTFARSVTIGCNGFNQQAAYDDILVLAPSLRLTSPASAAVTDELVTGSVSGATARVSDFEPSKGRIWLHSWDGTPWGDGETLTGSTSGVLGTVSVVDARYIDGFEPWSFPRPQAEGGLPFVLATTPQQATATQLVPVGNPNNADNVNTLPVDYTTRNEATGGTKGDSYRACTPLPAWAGRVEAIQAETFVESASNYIEHDVTVTTGVGPQSLKMLSPENAQSQPFALTARADGTSFTPSDVASLTVRVDLEEV